MTRSILAMGLLAMVSSCGGGSGGPVFPPGGGASGNLSQSGGQGGVAGSGGTVASTGSNVITVVADQGPQNIGYTDGLFATVTLCEPGTSNCQTFDHLLVDTGSVGVRVLESELKLALPAITNTSGAGLAECTPFVDGTSWGPVKRADVRIGGESASNLSVQVIGENTYAMPGTCTGTPITDFQSLGSNGILGVGIYLQDCGKSCQSTGISNPGLYYACTSAGACSATAVPLTLQVAHPVAAFPVDNNGVIIQLPSVPSGGLPSTSGSLIFGIGTQANNDLGTSTVLPVDSLGFVTTTYPVGGTAYSSYLDSGSNGLFFLSTLVTNIKACTGGLKDFYCPSSIMSLSATISSSNGASTNVAFNVANVSTLNAKNFVFSDLAGPMPGFPKDTTVPGFDWGLPFFFGRTVATSIESKSTPAGTGPYFAF
jgi:Protein of unknown function (DUF3443)